MASSGGGVGSHQSENPAIQGVKRARLGSGQTDEETQTNTRVDTRSPVRGDNQAFASHALINAKLEQIQGGSGANAQPSLIQQHHALSKIPEFEPIEEMKDPKYEEMTMSKVDSDHVASEVVAVGNKENTSILLNNQQKYIDVPII